MLKIFITSILIAGFALSGCSLLNPFISTPTRSSGIVGQVTIGPVCPGPVRIGDNQCQDRPYQATISILDSNNHEIYQFQTDNSGYFTIPLSPGAYNLLPESGNPLPRAATQTVVVIADQYTQVSIVYDTGIR